MLQKDITHLNTGSHHDQNHIPPLIFGREVLAAGWQLHLDVADDTPIVNAKVALKCEWCASASSGVRLLSPMVDGLSFGRAGLRPPREDFEQWARAGRPTEDDDDE